MRKNCLTLWAAFGCSLAAHAQPASVCPAPPPIDMAGAVAFGNGTPASCTQAALQALLNAGGNITCNCGPAPFTLTLTSTLQVPNRRVVLDGANRLTISGGNAVRLFDKAAAASPADGNLLGLQNLILRDGFVVDNGTDDRLGGAAIRGRAHGKLQVTNVQFINNVGPVLQSDACGAVHTIVYDDVVFAGCTFTSNRGANGGAVGTIGSAQRFFNCLFEDNKATGTGGTFDKGGIGGAVYVDGVDQNGITNTMSLCGCQLRRNTANKQGGAAALIFYANKGSSSSIDRCTFEDNTVTAAGDLGGGLYYLNGPLDLTNSTFARNATPGAGGGLWVTNTLLSVRNTTFSSNVAGLGGGLAISGGAENHASLLNTTFSGNQGSTFASAIFNIGDLTLGNSIFYNNLTGSANQANAYAGGTINNGSSLTLEAGNLQWPQTFMVGGNVVQEGWLTSAVLVADAQLAPLANNGGPTPTQAIPAGSPAINLGTAPGAPATDQRGAPRVGQPDAGAYEFGAPLPVELVAFGAQRQGEGVVAKWQTAQEHNNQGFIVERSADGQTFQAASPLQPGAGSSTSSRHYSYLDERAPRELTYYRLLQQDIAGAKSYSPVVAVAAVGVAALGCYPQPAHGATSVTGAKAGARVTLLNTVGRTVLTTTADASGRCELRLPLGLAPGVYIVRSGSQSARLTVE